MNERIKELAKQADAHAHNRMAEIGGSYLEYYNEKFAELIIRECMDRVHDEVQYIADFDEADQVVNAVKKHFGVKE